MNFSELIKQRQSNRSYQSKPVEQEKIEQCLEAARLAPSANNAQSWTFVVVDEPELKNRVGESVARLGMNQFVNQAPVLIAVVVEKPIFLTRLGSMVQNKDYPLIDIGIAVEHICLQAADLGLGSCIVGWFNENDIKKLLNIPRDKRLALIVALGYPKDVPREKRRKLREEVIHFNRY
ncbi:MAG: nitroreductase family protein [Candidatus Symbiothrix sp.]|jgi:nitroreductase|nr:nitroreductase family protein [Candidatus Symbiothrix sp.]